MNLPYQVEIQAEVPLEPGMEEPLRQAALAALVLEGVQERCEVMIVIADDDTLRELNWRFRGVNAPTDVLSFANESRGPFAGGGGQFPHYLGDLVISLPTAQAQAEAVGGTLVHELQLLIVHGVLHLLGYDHAGPEEKSRMWAAQERILQRLGVTLPLPE